MSDTGEEAVPDADGSENGADPDATDAGGPVGMVEARSNAVSAAEELLTHPVEDVIKVAAHGDGWRVVIEVKERDAVPDTQDMLARYELLVDARGRLTEYGLLERYKRGDMRGDL